MRKIRRTVQSLCYIAFIAGIFDGMKTRDLAAVLVCGTLTLALIAAEGKDE